MEEDIHAPGPPIDARGTNLYVQLGRGRDYASQGTSSTPTHSSCASRAADSPRSAPTTTSSPASACHSTSSTTPGPQPRGPGGRVGDPHHPCGEAQALGEDQRQAVRVHTPSRYVFPRGRSVRARVRRVQQPEQDALAAGLHAGRNHISYTFRLVAASTTSTSPTSTRASTGKTELRRLEPAHLRQEILWRHFNPGDATEEGAPLAAHPHVKLEQPAGAQLQHRLLLALPIAAASTRESRRDMAGSRKMSLLRYSDMEGPWTCAVTALLPWILKVINKQPVTDSALKEHLQKLTAWHASGARRPSGRDVRAVGRHPHPGGRNWSPPSSSRRRTDPDRLPFGHDAPGPVGSAFDTSSYGYVPEGPARPVGNERQGPLSRVYCGHGNLAACRGGA